MIIIANNNYDGSECTETCLNPLSDSPSTFICPSTNSISHLEDIVLPATSGVGSRNLLGKNQYSEFRFEHIAENMCLFGLNIVSKYVCIPCGARL